MRNWAKLEFSSIYYLLKRLEEKKLVESKIMKTERKPSRKVYYITDEGKLAVQEKVKHILSENQEQISSFDLAMANIQILNSEEVVRCLKLYLKSTNKRIDILEMSFHIQESNNSPPNVLALFTRPLVLLKAEKQWIQEFIKTIETQ